MSGDSDRLPDHIDSLSHAGDELPGRGHKMPAGGDEVPRVADHVPADSDKVPPGPDGVPGCTDVLSASGYQVSAHFAYKVPCFTHPVSRCKDGVSADGNALPCSRDTMSDRGHAMSGRENPVPAETHGMSGDADQMRLPGGNLGLSG